SQGLSVEEPMAVVVRGLVEPIARHLPMEYALELNKLSELHMEGSGGEAWPALTQQLAARARTCAFQVCTTETTGTSLSRLTPSSPKPKKSKNTVRHALTVKPATS